MKGINDSKLSVGKSVVDGENQKLTDFATLVVNGSTEGIHAEEELQGGIPCCKSTG